MLRTSKDREHGCAHSVGGGGVLKGTSLRSRQPPASKQASKQEREREREARGENLLAPNPAERKRGSISDAHRRGWPE